MTGDPSTSSDAAETGRTERREVEFSGRVQGVGFRYTTRAIAARLPVTGFVRNRSDGSVELVVEGTPAALDELLAGIAGELGRFIVHREVVVRPASGEFPSFEIAF